MLNRSVYSEEVECFEEAPAGSCDPKCCMAAALMKIHSQLPVQRSNPTLGNVAKTCPTHETRVLVLTTIQDNVKADMSIFEIQVVAVHTVMKQNFPERQKR